MSDNTWDGDSHHHGWEKRKRRLCTFNVDRNLFTNLSSNTFTVGAEMEVSHMDLHSYTHPQSPERVPLPNSMPNTPESKKLRSEPTLAEVQDTIIKLLKKKTDERADGMEKKADGLEKLIQHNAASIDALKAKHCEEGNY